MNKRKPWILAAVILAAVIFFPYTTKTGISGDGEIQDQAGEKTGDCVLSVEISEIRSLLFSYKRCFSYKLGDTEYDAVETANYVEADDLNIIYQWYQNKKTGELDLRSMEYPDDLSYVLVTSGTERYYLKAAPS